MNTLLSASIISRLNNVMNKIADVCNISMRNKEDVKLIIVTKGHTTSEIEAVIHAGAKFIGENYPEETSEKISSLGLLARRVQWHMIGHLQSRKTKLMFENYDYFQALDSLKLAMRLNQQIPEERGPFPVLLQYNVGGEETKYGWDASNESKWPELLIDLNEISKLEKLDINGLMTMPPLSNNKNENRVYFERLRRLAEYFSNEFPNIKFHELSMGTSHDYEEAIKEGATFIRIGTAIMGDRDYSR
jgi:hypothetical protein